MKLESLLKKFFWVDMKWNWIENQQQQRHESVIWLIMIITNNIIIITIIVTSGETNLFSNQIFKIVIFAKKLAFLSGHDVKMVKIIMNRLIIHAISNQFLVYDNVANLSIWRLLLLIDNYKNIQRMLKFDKTKHNGT